MSQKQMQEISRRSEATEGIHRSFLFLIHKLQQLAANSPESHRAEARFHFFFSNDVLSEVNNVNRQKHKLDQIKPRCKRRRIVQ